MNIVINKILFLKLFSIIFFLNNISLKENNEIKTSFINVVFVGDLMCHMPQVEAAKITSAKDSFNFFESFNFVKPFISQADIALGNLETVIGGKELTYTGYPNFNSPFDYLRAIKEAGFDFLVASNNHSMDRGKVGIIKTIDALNSLSLGYTGIFNSDKDRDSIRIVTIKDISIAVLSYSYGLNGRILPEKDKYLVNLIDTTIIKTDILKAKEKNVDIILTYFHFGDEYIRLPNKFQNDVVDFSIKYGADIVIGSHPHVLQPIKKFKGNHNLDTGFVAYSLGNFISGQRKRYTDCGIILGFNIVKHDGKLKLTSIEGIPTWVYNGYIDNKKNFYILKNSNDIDKKYSFLNNNDIFKAKQALEDTKYIMNYYKSEINIKTE